MPNFRQCQKSLDLWFPICLNAVLVSTQLHSAIQITRPRPGIVTLTLNRPDQLNAMNAQLVGALRDALDDVAADVDARVVVLAGSGRAFCAGGDLKGYGEFTNSDRLGPIHRGLAIQREISALVPQLRSIPQPVIAAVHGAAAGGGLSLLLGSDVRLAGRSAKFSVAFIRVGLSGCDIGTSWLLPRIVGVGRAQELMLTGRTFDADEAHRIGLVLDVYDDDALLDAAYAKADEIMANSPLGVALTKESMWTALEIPGLHAAIEMENRQQVMLSTTDDLQEARASRAARRPPQWKNS